MDKNIDYEELGLMMGLEIHQQLNTAQKLFCPCECELTDKKPEYRVFWEGKRKDGVAVCGMSEKYFDLAQAEFLAGELTALTYVIHWAERGENKCKKFS